MNSKFTYTDEEDKSYGLTGMALSLNIWDQNNMLRELSLDSEDGITFTPDFYFCSNPRFSAKIAWNEMLKQYQILTGMVMGNILSRYRVHRRKALSQSLIAAIYALVAAEGREQCSLEKDEIDVLFNKTLNYLNKVYSSPDVAAFVENFATMLIERRTMSGSEVDDELQMLRMI